MTSKADVSPLGLSTEPYLLINGTMESYTNYKPRGKNSKSHAQLSFVERLITPSPCAIRSMHWGFAQRRRYIPSRGPGEQWRLMSAIGFFLTFTMELWMSYALLIFSTRE